MTRHVIPQSGDRFGVGLLVFIIILCATLSCFICGIPAASIIGILLTAIAVTAIARLIEVKADWTRK